MDGLFRTWMDRNLLALERVRHLLTTDNANLLDDLIALRTRPFWHCVIDEKKLRREQRIAAFFIEYKNRP